MSPTIEMEYFERRDRNFAIPSGPTGARSFLVCAFLFCLVSVAWMPGVHGVAQAQVTRTYRETEPVDPTPHFGDKIGPGVRETLESQGSARVVVALATPASLKRPTRAKFNEIRRDVENVQNAVIGVLSASDHNMRRRYRMVPAFAADIRTQKALDRLERHPLVVRIDLDEKVTTQLAQSVSLIRADSMHAHGYTGEGVVVAILDTGIDTDHPDLVDDLIHEECFLGGPFCPNGTNRQSGPGAAEDESGHGTHVSGIITSAGIVSQPGVAPDAQIIAIKVLAWDGTGWTSDVFAGLDWLVDNREDVDLVNMSFGGGLYEGECNRPPYAVVVNTLRAVGVTPFAASGNDYSNTSMIAPACVPGVVSVGATDDNDNITSYTNSNAYTDLMAPGVGIISTWPGGGTSSKQGTSMASPHAVGCAALQLGAGRASTPGSLEAWLKGSGVPVKKAAFTFPRIECFREPSFLAPDHLFAVAGSPDATGCGGTGSFTLNVVGGTISRTGDTSFNNWAVGYSCWGFDEEYVRVYMVADDPATFDHWESPSGHMYLIDGYNGTSATTIETSFNLLGQSPTFESVHAGGSPTPDLITIDRGTGAGAVVGSLSGGSSSAYPAIAVHPVTKVMYAGGGNGDAVLYTVDPLTGALSPVGAAGPRISRIAAMDFHPDGTLFASVKETFTSAPGANWLATIDTSTGEATLVGSFSVCGDNCAIEGMEAIAFDPGGILHGAVHERATNGTPGLYMIDRFTGRATFVAPILDESSNPASGGIASLQFVDGMLYGGTAVSKSPPGDGGWLVTIDETTGRFIKVGAASATGGRGLVGMAPPIRLSTPPNDDLAGAFQAGALPYYGLGNNVNATTEPSEAYGSCSSDHGKSIWWSFAPTESRRFEINTYGSDVNTGLSIWSGSGHPLDELSCDDDDGAGTTSRIRFDGSAGETYFIRVIGYAGTEGGIGLNVAALDFDCDVQTDIPAVECLALGDLFDSTKGAYWKNNEGWKFTNTPCSWFGVTCTDDHVAGLDLYNNNLNGPLPSSIGDLGSLTYLNLRYNNLPGGLPASIGSLGNLTWLRIDHSGLGGTIPETIGSLGHLEYLDLYSNGLTGSIPASIGNLSQLTELQLQVNGLAGPIPESIGNLTNLLSLSLSENSLEGPLPETLGYLTGLTQMSLSRNSITGPIPESIGDLTSLEWIDFGMNQLTGPIPESIGNLANLSELHLEGNSLTGSIPETIGNLANLSELHLYSNDLSGRIPESIGKLTKLKYLLLPGNNLTGPIPPTLGNMTGLMQIDLGTNNLGGTIPLPAARVMGQSTWFGPPTDQSVALLPRPFACSVAGNPNLCIPDIPEYQALASGGQICGLPLDPACEPIVHAEAKAFLEGPYSTGAMRADTMFTSHCPSSQPYADPFFDGTPLECDAPDLVSSPPDSVMDWVLVSLRAGVSAESEVLASVRAAFLLTNGSVVDTAGGILAFPGVAPGGYRMVVRHRNHASIMSADTLDLSDGLGSWDFTTAVSQAYTTSGAPMKQLSDGKFGMFACDANVDGQITAPDFNLWNARTTAGAKGYEQADCNLDGQVTAPDFNLWNANTTAGAKSQVPD